jgi:hypothetical protein
MIAPARAISGFSQPMAIQAKAATVSGPPVDIVHRRPGCL